jgi:hypothetical protein
MFIMQIEDLLRLCLWCASGIRRDESWRDRSFVGEGESNADEGEKRFV